MNRYDLKTVLASAPGLVASKDQRQMLGEMRRFDRALPQLMRRSVPEAIAELTPSPRQKEAEASSERQIRRLSNIAIMLNGDSELGLCLRRSLLRYRFLRQIGLAVTINFGARMIAGKPDRAVTGHAWLTLDNSPYFEAGENWRDFTVMYSYPPTLAEP